MSLQVWLPLNGSLENKGIEGNDLINNGATVNNNGKIGQCYYFDGIDDRLYNKFNLDSEVFSIALWFKASQLTSNSQYLISLNSGNIGSAGQQFAFIITTSGVASMAGGNYTLASYNFNINEWYHLALTSNGTIQTLYINGNEQIEYSVGTVKGNNLTIGARSNSNSGAGESFSYPFNGYINDVRIYDECLSKEQIHQISQGLILHYPLNSGYGNENLMRMGGLDKNGATSMTYDSSTDTYTIVSPAGTNSWGYGVSIRSTSEISIPYGKSYRASVEVYVPTQHSFVVDINNNVANGTTAWAGNDNDNTSKRTSTSFTIPANTWKKISWGSENSNGNNTDKVVILPYDKFGLKTNSDTDSVTWYLRHPKIELGTSVTDWCPNSVDVLYTTLGYDSTTVYDTSGFGNDGTMVNNIIHTSDTLLYDSSVNLQRTKSNYINLQNTYITNQSTINFWGKVNTFGGWQRFFEFCNVLQGATGNHRILLGTYHNTQQLGLHIYGGETGTTSLYVNSNITTIDTNWHMYSIVFNKTNLKVFMDGKSIVDATMTQELTSMVRQYSYIGKSSYSADAYFDGEISDFRIYATALSAEDIKQLYQTKAKIDKNGNVYCNQFIESNNIGNLLDDYQYPVNSTTHSGVFSKVLVDCQDSITGKATKMTCNTAGLGFYIGGCWNTARSKFVNGKQYIWSMYVKSDNRTSITFNVECSSKQSKNTFIIDTNYRRIESVFTYSNSTAYSAFTCYSNFKVNENLYIHTFSVDEYNPKTNVDKKGILHTNSLIEIKSEEKCKIYKQDIQSNEIIEI